VNDDDDDKARMLRLYNTNGVIRQLYCLVPFLPRDCLLGSRRRSHLQVGGVLSWL